MRILYNFQKLINKPEDFTKEKRDRLKSLLKAYLPDIYRRNCSSAFQWVIVEDGILIHCWWYNYTDAEKGTRNYEEFIYDSEFPFDDSKIIIMSLF